MKEIAVFNNENVTLEEAKRFRVRKAVRAIIFDDENNIAIVHAAKRNFYELPGGGVEDGEDFKEAITRECREEIGCEVIIEKEIGMITEYKRRESLKKETYCYVGRIIGEKGELNLSDHERDLKISIAWVPRDKALTLIQSSDKPISDIAEFSIQRDVIFLEGVNL